MEQENTNTKTPHKNKNKKKKVKEVVTYRKIGPHIDSDFLPQHRFGTRRHFVKHQFHALVQNLGLQLQTEVQEFGLQNLSGNHSKQAVKTSSRNSVQQ